MHKLNEFQLNDILEAANKAITRGPWMRSGVRTKVDEKCIMVGRDDFLIAALPVGHTDKDYAGSFRDAGFIAMCDPDTITSIVSELIELRKNVND